MQSETTGWEKRSAKRNRATGKVWWIGQEGKTFREGWMFDTSKSGLAFLTPRGATPAVPEKVSVTRNDPINGFADCETLRVARVEPHGPAFNLVGCTRFP